MPAGAEPPAGAGPVPLRVVHVASSDVNGGAARAANRLHQGLRLLGHDSRMLVAQRLGDDPSVVSFFPSRRFPDRVARVLRRRRIAADFAPYRATRPAGFEAFSDDRSEYGPEVPRQLPPCDVVNLHWVAGFVDYEAMLAGIPRGVPVVWTLHDMNVFTGGCHYDDGCGRFARACGACPQLGSRDEHDLSRQVWLRKRNVFGAAGRPLHVVADSEWLAAEARRSSALAGVPVTSILYGLDTGVFAPRDPAAARAELGIPAGARVVLFVADSVENRRKGFPLLLEALGGMRDAPGLLLLSIGRGRPAVPGGLPHLHFEHVASDRLLSILYSAADVFVIPSLQEAFGQTALEAMACGTPVVGFDAGGIPEMVRPGVTGLLARCGDVAGLREAVLALLSDDELRARMGASCRELAAREHGLEVQARRYAELYRALLGAAPLPAGG